ALIALNSTNKFLLATSVTAPFIPFLVVATLRLLAPDPLFYAIGRIYGDRALHWARDVFPGTGPLLDEVGTDGGAVRRLLHVLIVIMPNNPVCLVAGVTRFPIRRFVVLNVLGTIGRVLLMWWIGHLFSDQIHDLLDVVARYQRWFLLASVVLVVAYLAWQVIGRRGLIGGVEELEDELGDG
ncbi:MAG: VTT domain-containing protein, partial [Actinobacteria bacterium]|nr:VTT domain-containing protein [Actinomycetota bacterium]